jgi:hypothetical protein
MWLKPPILFVIAAFVFVAYANYIFYQIWFNSKKFTKSNRKRIYALPGWHPLRNLYINLSNNDKSWISTNKILSIFGEIFVLTLLVLIMIAWIKGK